MKCFFVWSDNLERVKDVRSWLDQLAFEVSSSVINADCIIVVGGDGTMLKAIHEYWRFNLPFFGINRGTKGFLLNPIATLHDLNLALENYLECKTVSLRLLKATFEKVDGALVEHLAFNDVFIKAEHGAVIWGKVSGDKFPEQNFCGDGLIVAAPQGSTAYNRSAGGSILPLDHNIFSITTICPMYLPIRSTVSAQKITLVIDKGPAIGFADFFREDPIKSIVIEPGQAQVRLVFIPTYDFEVSRYKLD